MSEVRTEFETHVSPEITGRTYPQIALFDMDGSLCDYEGQLRRDLERLRSPHEPEIGDLWEMDKIEWAEARMNLIKKQVGWWRNLPRWQAGFDVFQCCIEIGYQNQVLTKGPSSNSDAWGEKHAWCQAELKPLDPNVKVNVTEDKSIMYGKVLVDDFPDYVIPWLSFRPRGLVIMPAQPYNESFTHPQVIRYDGTNWGTVERALVAAYRRKPNEPLMW